ncbi:hypothetical protein AGMMS50276_16620 [Synergistales bacterium]|nr:hypothetical protein AGMMS50276_16620 [Synergistales bacterium]
MFVKDGIAYAGELEKTLKVVAVRPLAEYKLWLRFSTGEEGVFDCKTLLKYPAFQPLANVDVFSKVYVDYGVTVWNDGEIDIAPEKLYSEAVH